MKMNVDLNKIAQKGMEFVKNNPVLCIGTTIGVYIATRNYIRIKRMDQEIQRMKNNNFVKDSLNLFK